MSDESWLTALASVSAGAVPREHHRLMARKGLVLDRSELMVLLNEAKATTVIGLPESAALPSDVRERTELLARGEEQLAARGWLRVQPDGTRLLPLELGALALLISRPEITSITIRNLNRLGSQLFLHYYAGGVGLEQTFPVQGQHRFVALTGVEQICQRLIGILPLSRADTLLPVPEIDDVPQDVFFEVRRLIESGQVSQAEALLTPVVHLEVVARSLVHAFARPALIATVAVIHCAEDANGAGTKGTRAVDGRNILLAQDTLSAWLLQQRIPGEPALRVTHADRDLLYFELRRLFDAMRSLDERMPA
jgi:hypothetical protein